MKLISCNGKNIHHFVKTLVELVSPLRWDRMRNRVYDENFYWLAEIYKNGILKLTFLDQHKNKHQLNISKQDTVTYLVKKKQNYGYFSQADTVITHFFEQQEFFS